MHLSQYLNQEMVNKISVLDPTKEKENEFNKIIPIEDLNSHIYVMASTKSGKSEFIKFKTSSFRWRIRILSFLFSFIFCLLYFSFQFIIQQDFL